MRSFATILLSLSLPLHVFAAHAINHARRHDVALRPRAQVFSPARLTYYDITTGTTACGGNYPASAMVVAMNADQFGGVPGHSEWCGKTITITYAGKSVTVTVVDKCPGCPLAGLDLTQGVFSALADVSKGVLTGSWTEGNGAADTPTTSSEPAPSPTSHYTPPTTSSHTTSSPPPPSSTSTSTTSKTSSSVSSATSTTSHQPSSSTPSPTQTSSSGLAVPSGTGSNEQDQAIPLLLQAVLGLGNIVAASKS